MCAALKKPSVVPSRYLEQLRHSWDSKLQLGDTMVAFKESVGLLLQHATTRVNKIESELVEILSVQGATRHRVSNVDMQEKAQMLERDVQEWTKIQNKCRDILTEVDEHVGYFTDAFIKMMKDVVEEVKRAPWSHPFEDPWESIKFFHTPTLLDMARDVPPVTIDSSAFHVTESHCWSAVNFADKRRPVHLKITCCCQSKTDSRRYFLGTSSGNILSIDYRCRVLVCVC